MEFVSAIIGPIVESLMVPVKKQLDYLFFSTKHVRNMSTRMDQLDGTSLDVKIHIETNNISNLEVPARVSGWLAEVEKIKKDAHSISSTGNGCLNMKMRYRVGRNAYKISEDIRRLIDENSEMVWSNAQKPLGRVNSKNISTSGDGQNHFKSREQAFKDALEFLQQDHESQVIALCGMAGVGKSTMMDQLKKSAEDKKMFDYIVKVVIGQTLDMPSIQQAVAVYIGQSLPENPITARADLLRLGFEKMSEEKKKVLVILDDVWETIELKDVGLSPLPNGFKLLLTSRDENICTQIAVESNLAIRVVRVKVMEELEAHNFFWQITGVSKQDDPELSQIGSDIVRRCGCLPLAIKLIATTLSFQEKFVWRNTLQRLKKKNLDKNVQEVIEISYSHIKEEDEKAIFRLCGLFPDDFDIEIEELTRYAWGLQLFNEVFSLGDARDRTKTCVQNLKYANLLIDSDYLGCVKMHDLVHAFLVGRESKGDHEMIVNHGDLRRVGMSKSCKRISITCKGMSEFPGDFKYPNVSLLRLMHGDKSLEFPQDFYERMQNLEVVAYEQMQYPLLPRSLQGSTNINIRTLLLHQCLLMHDCSAIGELVNLEILSFAHCGIRKLPSTIGNLKELKILDLTGCVNLRVDDGVLKNLVKLEELYMRVSKENAIMFTDGNHAELAQLSEHLSALEIEFFRGSGRPENMSYVKLERFKISMNRSLGPFINLKDHVFENTLTLANIDKDDVLECGVNELFQKTEVLYLEVDGMNDLEEMIVESVHLYRHSFYNLRVLDVYRCANLRYLFTVPMASGLMKLERLTVYECAVMDVLVYSENGGDEVIKFQGLKYLSLEYLPKLVGFCNIVTVIELPELVELRLGGLPNFTCIYPENTSTTSSLSSNVSAIQPFFNKEVLIPKLEILQILAMNKLKEIWPYQSSSSDQVMLREIHVGNCDNIVNLFPTNPMLLLRHLEELDVSICGSIQALFRIDMTSVGEIEQHMISSKLRHISVFNLNKLREVWRIKGESSTGILNRCFQAVEKISISVCESFVNVFTPTNPDYVTALMNVSIDGRRHSEEISQEINVISKEGISTVYDGIHEAAFPLHRLKELNVFFSTDVEVVFEIESWSSRDLTTTQQPLILPYDLKVLSLSGMERMSHVWKCNWNNFLIPHAQSKASFHNLTTISLDNCKSIKYLFSPLIIGKLLPNLKKVDLYSCDAIEEVVSNTYDDEMAISTPTNTIFFPCLDYVHLHHLPHLKSIDGVNVRAITNTTSSVHHRVECSRIDMASWFLCQHCKKIDIQHCDALSSVIPSYVVGRLHTLEELRIEGCRSMVEVFEIEGANNNNDGVHITNVGDGNEDTCTAITIPRLGNMSLLQLPNLTRLEVIDCELLEYIFTSSMLESLKQLKELEVKECQAMQVIVKLEDGDHIDTSKTIVFPRLKSITLANLPNLKAFFLGMNAFRWPLLEKVEIFGCPQMMNFTSGHSTAPKLNYIHRGLTKHILEHGLNFHPTDATHETDQVHSWYSNLVEVDTERNSYLLSEMRIIFPCNELVNLKNLGKIYITDEKNVSRIDTIFEVADLGRNDDDVNVVEFPNLKEVVLYCIHRLQHMWKSNRWMVLKFPNLRKVSITRCGDLGHVFTGCMVGSLLQLQELQISDCWKMEEIIVEEDSETKVVNVFPCLKSITLDRLPNLKGFCLGNADYEWPLLDTLEIKDCPQITVFTNGQSTTPKLKVINTNSGLCDATGDPNSFIKAKRQEEGWWF